MMVGAPGWAFTALRTSSDLAEMTHEFLVSSLFQRAQRPLQDLAADRHWTSINILKDGEQIHVRQRYSEAAAGWNPARHTFREYANSKHAGYTPA
jgi:hypothetical protein